MRFTPIQVLVVYIAFTFSLILFGPIRYLGFDPLLTGGFLLAVLVAMGFGYYFGIRKTEYALASPPEAPGGARSRQLFLFCLGVSLVSLAASVIEAIFAGQLNLSTADLGQTYIDYYQGYERNTGSYSVTFLIYSFAAAPTFIASVWGLVYFKQQRALVKAAVIVLIAGTVLFYTIGSGKQEALGRTLAFVLVTIAISFGRGGRVLRPRTLIVGSLALLVGVSAFVAILSQRYAALTVDLFTINARNNPLQVFDLDHPIFKWFGPDFGFSLAMFCSYLSQGYFGLSQALHTNFEWTYFIGFSYSLTVVANRFLGLPWMYEQTYPYRVGLASGWGESKWHSIFPYWASDFTFPGTVILFGIFASIFAGSWLRSIRSENPYAVLQFALMAFGAIFIPANNQLFISPGGVSTVVVVSILYWQSTRRAFPAIVPATQLQPAPPA